MALSAQTASVQPAIPSKRNKKPDPFLDLANAPISSALSSPDGTQGDLDDAKSIITKIILTPLLFTSFIISLFVVQRRDRAYRVNEHPPLSLSWWSRISPSQWFNPEPYQEPDDSTRHEASAGTADGCDGSIPGLDGHVEMTRRNGKIQWYTRKKHRKMARLHFIDAFELQGKAIVAIIITWVMAFWGLYWSVRKLSTMMW